MTIDPADYLMRGESEMHRAPDEGAAATWRGLSLSGEGGGATVDSPGEPIPFDTVLAQTDGIRTTSSHVFGAYTLPAGAGGQVPVGMAGLWRMCVNNEFTAAANSGLWALLLIVNNFEWFLEKSYVNFSPPDTFTWSIAPVVRELAEGDIVWAFANVQGAGVNIGGPDATLLMEYLGPVLT